MKKINNNYQLLNKSDRLSPEDVRKSLKDFEYFMSNFQQITNKDRQVVPFKLNKFQKKLFETVLPLVNKETRKNKRHSIVLVKSRQVGASVSVVALINYICAFVDGMHDITCLHIFPVADTITKFYNKKVEPIISGVHPDLFPNIERETLGSSIMTRYNSIKGVRRNCYYELVSSGASSIRSDSVHIALFDEYSFYAHPDVLEDAVGPALPDNSWSLVIYLSTFEDRKSDSFIKKIKIAQENPEDWTMVFAPWYLTYPESKLGIPMNEVILTDYDKNVIIPAMIKDGIPESEWGDCIDWYHRKKLTVANMEKEFPTTIEEILSFGQDDTVFSPESIERQRKNVEAGMPCRLLTDTVTRKVEAISDSVSPFTIFKKPIAGRRYVITIDPITANNEDTDFFCMSVMDVERNEQVATFRGKEYMTEDYADFAITIAKLYNNAVLCPERNVAEGFVAAVRSRGYYYFYYENDIFKKRKEPGIRTTVTSKENMIDKLRLLLDNDRIILHDKVWVDELSSFVKRVKVRGDGSRSVKMEAKKGKHDDSCFAKDTMIMTDSGERPIQDIKVGDMVLTSKGYRRVNGTSARLADTITKYGITATPNHPFFTTNGIKEWKDIDENDKIYVCPYKRKLKELTRKASNTAGLYGEGTLNLRGDSFVSTINTISDTRSRLNRYTDKSTKTTSARYRRGGIYTTKTETQRITLRQIFKHSQQASMPALRVSPDGRMKNIGTRCEKDMRTKTIERECRKLKRTEKLLLTLASYATRCSRANPILEKSGGAMTVQNIYTQTLTDSISIKNGKLKRSESSSTRTKINYNQEVVYNLSVDDVHEYYANGVLVHNCATLWIYAGMLNDRQLTGRVKKKYAVL